jgi:Ca2+-binding EF-hand superfamily protein
MADLFAELDSDASGRLKTTELAGLADRKAHLALEAAFTSPGQPNGARATLRIVDASSDVVQVVHASPARLALAVGEEAIEVAAYDMSGADTMAESPRPGAAGPSNPLRISVHNRSDALFAHLDADHDGRLGEREIAQAADRFKSLDKDQDGSLSAGEVSGGLTVAIVRGNLPAGEARYNLLPAGTTGGDFHPPEWFLQGDFNGDGDISRREFVGTLDQFRQLDLNDDGFVSAAEAAVVEVH